MQALNFEDVLAQIVSQNPRYPREAYLFLREALDSTQKQLAEAGKGEAHHVTGQQLLEGLKNFALAQFGPMAKTVLNEWGIHRCEDVGEIVFNMVDHGLLSKTDTDSRDDFKGGYDLEEVLSHPFLPPSRRSVSGLPAEPRPSQA